MTDARDPPLTATTDPRAAIRRQALTLLARCERSRRELNDRLLARGYPTACVTEELDRLQAAGLLCEDRLAENHARRRFARGYGPLRVRAELAAKGLLAAQIDSAAALDDAACSALLADAAKARFGATPPDSPRERARRARFLANRGFPAHLIARFLNRDDLA